MLTETGFYSYPEVPESVVVFTPSSGERESYPAATDLVGWGNNKTLYLEFNGRFYGLNLRSRTLNSSGPQPAATSRIVGIPSPDGRYVAAPFTYEVKLWSSVDQRDLSQEILAATGGGHFGIADRSFWVRGKDHELCVGVFWPGAGESHGQGGKPERNAVLLLDAATARVVRKISGHFVAPAADGEHVVVWQEGRLVFVPL